MNYNNINIYQHLKIYFMYRSLQTLRHKLLANGSDFAAILLSALSPIGQCWPH